MKCEQAMQLIDGYLKDELPPRELAAFLDHIEACPDCYDEMETFFMIQVGTEYLEHELHESYDLPKMFREDIKAKRDRLKRRARIRRACFCLVLYVVIVVIISLVAFWFDLINMEIIEKYMTRGW